MTQCCAPLLKLTALGQEAAHLMHPHVAAAGAGTAATAAVVGVAVHALGSWNKAAVLVLACS